MLGSARCPEFRTEEGRRSALARLDGHGVDGLVVIGGNGSQTGADALSRLGFPVVGVASTIDNDLYGSEITIGVDTALNIALEAMDRLKVTASSHRRAFLVEVMGRDCGYLALMTAIAGGAEAVVHPGGRDRAGVRRGGDRGGATSAARRTPSSSWRRGRATTPSGSPPTSASIALGFELRVTILGHVQRGGAPGAFDRLLATRLGAAAVERLCRGESGVLVGLLEGKVAATPLAEVVATRKSLDLSLFELARVLAT